MGIPPSGRRGTSSCAASLAAVALLAVPPLQLLAGDGQRMGEHSAHGPSNPPPAAAPLPAVPPLQLLAGEGRHMGENSAPAPAPPRRTGARRAREPLGD